MKKTCAKMKSFAKAKLQAKRRSLLAIIAIVAVIGFVVISMIGCSSPGGETGGQTGGEDGKTVDKIEITTPPIKLHYNLGEDLDTTGMVVTATYSDGTEEDVTDYEVSGYDKTKAEHQPITVTYKGKTAEFSVNVIDPTLPTVATPTASPEPGTYDEVISVELTTTTPGATIYYTTDGSEPTEESDVYATAIDISETTTIKAFAVLAGYNDSDELEAEYILIFPFTSAPELTLEPDNAKIKYTWTASNPVADSYDVYWKQGSNLTADQVKTGTKIEGAISGGEITGLTNDTTYSVIVTAHKTGYTSIDSDVETAIPSPPYIITGSSASFTATQSGVTIGTANQAIQTVIDAIKTHAAGKACIIHFGNGETALDIGTATASFNNTSGTWGFIELSGKITGSSTNTAATGTNATIIIDGTVSITSTADIANTTANANARAIYNASTGTVNISGGEVKADTGVAVFSNSTGKITVSGTAKVTSANTTTAAGTILIANSGTGGDRLVIEGGTVENTAASADARAIYNNSTGTLTISGGEVKADTGVAVYNASMGKITVSGTAKVTSANVTTASGTIFIATSGSGGERLVIEGGTVENTAASGNARAIYNASTGDVSISSGEVKANTGIAVFNNSSGKITVKGTAKVTSANTSSINGTINLAGTSGTSADRLVIEGGTVENTADNANARAVYNDSPGGAVKISGGTVQVTSGNAVSNGSNGTGPITISGGTVQATTTGRAVSNLYSNTLTISGGTLSATSGITLFNNNTPTTVTISGGTIQTTSGNAVYISAAQTVSISGGTVSATTGIAVYNYSTSKVTVSGTARINSANTETGNGTIYLSDRGTGGDRLAIEGGTVENTGSGNAVFNASSGGAAISGGTVISTGNGKAVINASSGGVTISGGTVQTATGVAAYNASTGKIIISGTATVTSANASADSGTIYLVGGTGGGSRLEISGGAVRNTSTTTGNVIRNDSYGAVSISGGAVSKAGNLNWAVYNNAGGPLTINNSAAAITGNIYDPAPYIIIGTGGSFTATKNSTTVGTTGSIQDVIDAIRTNANGAECVVCFGDGTAVLDIDNASASFSGAWGMISLAGSIKSAVSGAGTGTIVIDGAFSVTSGADIENTSSDGNALYYNSTGALAITGGAVKAATGRTVHNNTTAAVKISGGTVSATTGTAVYNASTGTITVSGTAARVTSANTTNASGTIVIANSGEATAARLIIEDGTVENTATTSTNARTINNASTGSVNISGGRVTAAGGSLYNSVAVYIASTGAVNISGGTVQAESGPAVYNNSTGKITVSQAAGATTLITSYLQASSSGTIYLANTGGNTGTRLEITGGTVRSTQSGSGNYPAVYNSSASAVSISGGTVLATGQTAVYNNNSTGIINISGGTVSATGGQTVSNRNGNINISGGTVSATGATGQAVYNEQIGTITVSGSARITSANTSATGGTIYIANSGTATAARLEILGGTIQNTSTEANGNAIRNASTGAVTMSGGTVSTTATSGRAILNSSTGALTISNGTVSAPINATAYSIYNDSTGVVTVTSPPATITGARYPTP
jgi:hypothetical protein